MFCGSLTYYPLAVRLVVLFLTDNKPDVYIVLSIKFYLLCISSVDVHKELHPERDTDTMPCTST